MKNRGASQFGQMAFPGLGEGTAQEFTPPTHVREGAAAFAASQGRAAPSYEGLSTLQYPHAKAWAGHQEYKANMGQAPTPQTMASYQSLRRDVSAQFSHMTRPESEGGMGMQVEFTPHDPYSSAREMAKDISQKRIKVLSTEATGPHRNLTNAENDQLRAVHDVFGHAGTGRGFSRAGEEAAYQAHSQMFSPESQHALGAELRHQTSHLIFAGEFPPNQAVNLSDWAVAPKQGARKKT